MSHITILLAPAAVGKTDSVLEGMAKPRRGRAILLVPSGLHRDKLAPQVRARMPRASVYQPSRLISAILEAAAVDLPQASPTLRTRLMRAELRRLADEGELLHLAPVAHKPGLAAEVLALIDELQAAQATPEALAVAGVSPYDADLAVIYAAYRAALARLGVADAAGRMARATAAIHADATLLADLELFVVDGFDQFTSLQLGLLRALCARAGRSLITLTGGPGERPAHRRFRTTLTALRAALPEAELEYLSPATAPAPPLAHAAATIFELVADHTPYGGRAFGEGQTLPETLPPDILLPVAARCEREDGVSPPTADAAGAIQLISAPDREREVRAALRHVRRLLAAGTAPDHVAVIFRRAAPYAPLLREVAAEYGLPLAIAAGRPLAESPLVISLLAKLTPPAAELTPPAAATPDAYVSWLETLLGWADTQAQEAGGERRDSDLDLLPHVALPANTASGRLRRILADIADASRRLSEPPQSFKAFLADLQAAVGAASYDEQLPQPGRVAALDALAARSACFPHVVLIGLGEGEFPARLPAPAFYTRRERADLAARGVPLPAADPADERTLFYEAITRAQTSLTLSFTRLDEAGNPLQESAYLRDLLGRFRKGSIPRHNIRAGSAPAPAEAASPQERLIALMDAVRQGDSPAEAPDVPEFLRAHVTRACAIERAREGTGAHGPHEGVLADTVVIAELGKHFGPAYPWSVTQINDYTTCPFRFAAAHILRLEPAIDPKDGGNQMSRGRLLHAILAHAGRRWATRRMPAAAAHEEAYLADLTAAATEVLAAAPQTYSFAPSPFWAWEQAELRDTLARAIRRSLRDGGGWEQFTPDLTEESFGMADGRHALHLDTAAGPARIVGRIDRIDRAADGTLALIDYKSSRTPRPLDETLSGRDVQLTVYTLAAEQTLAASAHAVTRAGYLHLGSGKRSKALTPTDRSKAEESLRDKLGAAMVAARSGQFPVRPIDDCPPSCAFADICRLNPAKQP
ncbi:MAG: PD-(D/E)XK nuclease family protein [Chloroflexales bacterium]